ncbi:MAG: LptF/LptG family permease [Thermodesulfobacteriota bacterium]
MNLLDRYLFRQFASNFLLIVAALISIYLLIDVFERLDNFQEKDLAAKVIAAYFLAKVPVIYDQMAPICLLLAGIITLGLLMNRHELQTINAGGISKARVMRPLLAGVAFFTLLSLAFAQWLLPQASAQVKLIWQKQVKGQTHGGTVRDGVTFFRGEDGIYSFRQAKGDQNHFSDFHYVRLAPEEKGPKLLFAQRATAKKRQWQFANGFQQQQQREGEEMQLLTFNQLALTLPHQPDDFFTPAKLGAELPLSHLIRHGLGRQAKAKDRLELNRRLSFILLGVPLLLVALPLMLRFQRTRGSINLALAVPASAGLAFMAWGIWSGLQAMSQGGTMSPLLASWGIHLTCSAVGLVMLWRNTRF